MIFKAHGICLKSFLNTFKTIIYHILYIYIYIIIVIIITIIIIIYYYYYYCHYLLLLLVLLLLYIYITMIIIILLIYYYEDYIYILHFIHIIHIIHFIHFIHIIHIIHILQYDQHGDFWFVWNLRIRFFVGLVAEAVPCPLIERCKSSPNRWRIPIAACAWARYAKNVGGWDSVGPEEPKGWVKDD